MVSLSKEQLIELYTWLLKLRRVEEKSIELGMSGLIPGWLHSYLGQEATPVGVVSQLRREDYITGTHRGRGCALAKGIDLREYFAEILGRRDGMCRGRGGEMHLAKPEIGVMGASGIVGGILSTSVGLAFSAKYKGEDRVTCTFFGDGSTNEGSFHESVNLAALWKLPIIFVCENNGWAEYTSQRDSTLVENLSVRATSYGLPGVTVDGYDVLAVYEAAKEAIALARKGDGPTLLECKTSRWLGHYIGDPQKYRDQEELKRVRQDDAVLRFKNKLIKDGTISEAFSEELDKKIMAEIVAAMEFGKNSPFPSPESVTDFVYVEEGTR